MVLLGLGALNSHAQQGGLLVVPMQQRTVYPVAASVSMGPAHFNSYKPSSDIQLDQGTQFRFEIEKPINASLSVVTDLSLGKTTGKSHYYYQSYSSTYDIPDVKVNVSSYDLALGVKWRVVSFYGLSPFIQGGATGGYLQFVYDNLAEGAAESGTDYLSSEGALQMGHFGEIGFDYAFGEWGVTLANRYTEMSTRPFDTLKNQGIRYANNVYYLGVFVRF